MLHGEQKFLIHIVSDILLVNMPVMVDSIGNNIGW